MVTARDGAEWTGKGLPGWVPRSVRLYLDHTEAGHPIRALARAEGCHASTVLRRIRHCESRRDDMLVDHALRRLARNVAREGRTGSQSEDFAMTETTACTEASPTPDEARIRAEAPHVLRRLCEPGAVLAVAAQMENAVVVRDGAAADEAAMRTAVVPRALAEALALKAWIACAAPGRVSRYRITRAGRQALNLMVAERENRARGMAEARAGFDHRRIPDPVPCAPVAESVDAADETVRRPRYAAADTPLLALARRRDRDGTPFLSDKLVRAGDRLREDFELSRGAPNVTQNWDRFLTGGVQGSARRDGPLRGPAAAKARLDAALDYLGPGLGDIALRCCCHLEGLESAEKRMGWSARSGKIVLRIALQRLRLHYDALGEEGGLLG